MSLRLHTLLIQILKCKLDEELGHSDTVGM